MTYIGFFALQMAFCIFGGNAVIWGENVSSEDLF